MATASQAPVDTELQQLARRHLWMHFSRMGGYDAEHEIPIISRAEGCYVYDDHGNRYLDGLSGLFCVNAGHGRTEYGEAAARQVEELDFYTLWSYAHPRAIELAARIASLAPGDLNRVFFTNGGSEAVESALKLARNYHRMHGKGQKHKLIAREVAYHGTSLGALSATGITELRTQFEPLAPGGCHVPNTNVYRWPEDREPTWAADAIEERIVFEGPETVAAVILEPVQNAGGCFVPPDGYFQQVREICDRYDVLMISDEVICAWGRLGHYFGCERFGYVARHHHRRQGADLRLRADGRRDRLRQGRRAVHGGQRLLRPRLHLRRPPDRRGDRDGQPRRLRERGPLRPRARQGGRVPADAGDPARPADRRRRARRRLLPGDRDGQGQGDQRELRRRGVRAAAARLPLRRALQARPDLPRRRPRRPGDPAGAAADLRHRAVRRDPRRAPRASSPRPGTRSSDRQRRCSPSRACSTSSTSSWRPARDAARRAGALGPHLRAARTRPRGSPAAS